ncbi:hypothetical protein DOY81_011228 [Sarcophaga bullata]|nr:hypothetical protein DOY81_011228 [Sarcophaga bullata]
MNQSTNYTEYESWHADMDSSGGGGGGGGGLDHSADSNLSSSDNDRINSSPDNLLKSSSTSTTTGNKFNYTGHRRCRALYDCSADNDDELRIQRR